jgi:hypothetical protein
MGRVTIEDLTQMTEPGIGEMIHQWRETPLRQGGIPGDAILC